MRRGLPNGVVMVRSGVFLHWCGTKPNSLSVQQKERELVQLCEVELSAAVRLWFLSLSVGQLTYSKQQEPWLAQDNRLPRKQVLGCCCCCGDPFAAGAGAHKTPLGSHLRSSPFRPSVTRAEMRSGAERIQLRPRLADLLCRIKRLSGPNTSQL